MVVDGQVEQPEAKISVMCMDSSSAIIEGYVRILRRSELGAGIPFNRRKEKNLDCTPLLK